MESLNMSFLSGYRTYIIAALMILVGIVQGLTGEVGAWQGVLDNALIIPTDRDWETKLILSDSMFAHSGQV